MRAMRLALLFAVTSIELAMGSGCTGTTPCTPEEHGLANAPRLVLRELPGRAATPGACEAPRVEVIASEDDLRRLYEGIEADESTDAGAPDAGRPIEYPAVDFGRERVIVRVGPGNQAISWGAIDGDSAVLGLLACAVPQDASCVVNVLAVEAEIARATTRTCDPVACGQPRPAPVVSHGAR